MMIVEDVMDKYELTGTLKDGNTLVLDETLRIAEGKVRVTVQVEPEPTLTEYLEALHARQAARGHVPRTREEIDASLREERESWD